MISTFFPFQGKVVLYSPGWFVTPYVHKAVIDKDPLPVLPKSALLGQFISVTFSC